MTAEGRIKKLREQAKVRRKEIYTRTQWNEKTEKRQQQTKLAIQPEEINQRIFRGGSCRIH